LPCWQSANLTPMRRAVIPLIIRAMKTNIIPSLSAWMLVVAGALPLRAQVPDQLKHSIPAPLAGAGTQSSLGFSLATDSGNTVLGAPYDNTRGYQAGVVKIFDSVSGALLHVIDNPNPIFAARFFGASVAVSGTRVVVGSMTPFISESQNRRVNVYVYDLASATPTLPVTTLVSGTPYFGVSVAISGPRVVVGDATGSAFVYDLTSNTPDTPVLTLSNSPQPGFGFGVSVAISGNRVIVGDPFEDTGATDAGSAYIYNLAGGTPQLPVLTLNNPSPEANDQFGFSVALSGTRFVIGVPSEDTGATDAGSAYIYDLANGTPGPLLTLNNPDPDSLDRFGVSVAISGTRIVVGDPSGGTGATGAGSAYLYDLANGTPAIPVLTLNNPTPEAHDQFGFSVAITGTRIVVGAPYDSTRADDAGSAYLYDAARGTPGAPLFELNEPSTSWGDHFGSSVAIAGTRIVIGAPDNYETGGSVYVYDLASGAPVLVATLDNPSTPSANAQFGRSVAISGSRVMIGAPGDDFGGIDSGSAYLCDLAGGPPLEMYRISNPNPRPQANFGTSVAISGSQIVIGGPGEDDGQIRNSGIAYLFGIDGSTPQFRRRIVNPSSVEGDFFGAAVSVSGLLAAIGALYDNTGATDAGSVYLYDISNDNAVRIASIRNPSAAEGDYFGSSVALSGTLLVVGTPDDDSIAVDAGAAYVYDLSVSPPVRIASITNAGALVNNRFGTWVAISGTRVVISGTGASEARVYDIDIPGRKATLVATLQTPAKFTNNPVAIEGTIACLGAPSDLVVAYEKGAAYLFGPSPLSLFNHAMAVAGLTGADAQPLAVPFGDGQANLVKYAFKLNLVGPDVRTLVPGTGTIGLPSITLQDNGAAGVFRFEFLRRTESGLLYTPWKSTNLADPTGRTPLASLPEVTPIDSQWERVIHQEPFNFGTTPALFGGVQVTLP
jgi:hypothetical protein